MNKKTIFLLQGTKEQNEELKMMIEESGDYEVCGYAEDGISAIPAIEDKKPNVIITEIVLAGYDGLSFISKVNSIIEEAYAGDIIGVFDPGIFSIGDTVCIRPLHIRPY